MLEVQDISVRLGDRLVLDGATFAVPPGRVVGLLGPNGAGKTTAMRTVFGVIDPDRGQVCWDGRPAGPGDRARWGYMPQERGLYVKMRVRDHLVYLGRLRGLDRSVAKARADDLLERLGLAERAGDKIEQLSGGMQQRIQLAAALVHEPDVLVLDEPFAGLDPVAVDQLTDVILDQVREGRTLVFSSHQLDLVDDICETIVMIDGGRIVLDGDLLELKAASGERSLRLGMSDAPAGWADALGGVDLVHRDANELVFQLDPGTDPLAVLDAARAVGTVHDFGLELPRLSQLFREAVRA